MADYKAIVFDLGMTLIYPPMANAFQARLKELGGWVEKSEIRKALDYVDRHLMTNYPGYINRDVREFYTSYASLVFAYLHITDIPVKVFSSSMLEKSPPRGEWKLFTDTIPCLEKLKEMGRPIGLLTNWDRGARDLLKTLNLHHYFDSIVVSSEIDSEKPAPKGFLESLKNLGVKPEEALYIGDNHHDDVTGANNVGMKALLIERWGHHVYPSGDFERITDLTQICEYCCK